MSRENLQRRRVAGEVAGTAAAHSSSTRASKHTRPRTYFFWLCGTDTVVVAVARLPATSRAVIVIV